jgi:hypothetical protein
VLKREQNRAPKSLRHTYNSALLSLLALAGVLMGISAGPPAAADRELTIKPGDDIQALVQKSPPGTTFRLKAGIYRLQSVTPKDGDSFIGEPGSILNVARLLTEFTHEARYWVAKVHADRSEVHGQCDEDAPGCILPEDVFIDDQPLRHDPGAAALTAGKWHMDYDADRLYLADDPAGHKVEVSLTRHAFFGLARNVTIRGLIVEKYANLASRGAIHVATDPAHPGESWVIAENEVRFNHGAGIRFGHRTQVLRNNVHDNGQLGIAGSGENVLVEGNEIAHNNYAGYRSGWEGGGTKFAFTDGLVVRNNFAHDNNGPGLWTDIDNTHTLYENNRTTRNKRAGIAHEISFDAVIRNNTIEEDGFSSHPNDHPWWGGGILIIASSKVEIYGNHVTNCMNGIVAVQARRGSSKRLGSPYLVRDLYVHDNVITQKDGFAAGLTVSPGLGDSPFTSLNNRFDRNTYRLSDPEGRYYEWAYAQRNKTEWRAAGQDHDGSW